MDKELPKISQLSKEKPSTRAKSAKKAARSTMSINPKILAKTREISAKVHPQAEGEVKNGAKSAKKIPPNPDESKLDVLLVGKTMSKLERQMAIPTKIKALPIPPIAHDRIYQERFNSGGPVSPYRDVDSSSISDMFASNDGHLNLPTAIPIAITDTDAVSTPYTKIQRRRSSSFNREGQEPKTLDTNIVPVEEEEEELVPSIFKSQVS
jgi:hypothetical protein